MNDDLVDVVVYFRNVFSMSFLIYVSDIVFVYLSDGETVGQKEIKMSWTDRKQSFRCWRRRKTENQVKTKKREKSEW